MTVYYNPYHGNSKPSFLGVITHFGGFKTCIFHGFGVQGYMGVSKNSGTPKSSLQIGLSLINHPFWGTLIFGNTNITARVPQSLHF